MNVPDEIARVMSGEARWAVVQGDVLTVLHTLADASFDAVLSDVPYGLGPREPTAQEIADYVLGRAEVDTGGDFMGRKWKIPSVAVWREVSRVVKPGAPVLAFAGSRTHDLITIGMRAGGLEIGDTLMWLYSQSMPKPATTADKYIDWHLGVDRPVVGTRELTGNAAVNTKTKGGTYGIQVGSVPAKTIDVTAPATEQAKRWEGYGHALAPGFEPITLAYRPFDGTIANNILTHDVGGLNVAACRIGLSGGTRKSDRGRNCIPSVALEGGRDGSLNGGGKEGIGAGRWPKNVLLSHSADCQFVGYRRVRSGTAVKRNGVTVDSPSWGTVRLGKYPEGSPDETYADEDGLETIPDYDCVLDCPIRIMDEQSGDTASTLAGTADPSTTHPHPSQGAPPSPHLLYHDGIQQAVSRVYADMGGASRCYYHPKVSRAEREFGCEHLPIRSAAECTRREEGTEGTDRPQSGARRGSGARNFGPCLKPIDLTRYLAMLELPPPRPNGLKRRLLVMYCGTGSEIIGALRAGWDSILGIENDPEMITIARARIARWEQVRPDMDDAEAVRQKPKEDERQGVMFR